MDKEDLKYVNAGILGCSESELTEDLSQEVDSEGNTLTKEQVEFFRDSKVRDKQGRLLVVYHGTDAEFDTFKKGDIGFHFGTKEQANNRLNAKNVSNKIIKKYYLNIKNPYVLDTDITSYGAFTFMWFYCVSVPFDTSFDDEDELLRNLLVSKEEFDYIRKNVPFDDSDVNNAIRDSELTYNSKENVWVRNYLKSKGYDGVVYLNEIESFREKSYIAFNPNQIKSITNNTPSNSDNINEELLYHGQDDDMYDSEGNPLTKEQVEFFKNSKVRDSKGRLLVCYHSTSKEFNVFKYATFFTPNKQFSLGYGNKTKECYLNVKKPFIVDYDKLWDFVETHDNGEDYFENELDIVNEFGINTPDLYFTLLGAYDFSNDTSYYDVIDAVQGEGDYDGIILYNSMMNAGIDTQIVAFEPNQIKSITNKNPSNSNNINEDWLSDDNKKETTKQDYEQSYNDLIDNDKTRLYRYREWANNSNNDYKEYIYTDLLNGKKEDALHYWYNHYKLFTGNYDLSYDDFLNTPITLYRATNVNEKDDTTNPFFSYAQSKKLAQRFLDTTQRLYNKRTGEIEEIQIKPKDTLGMIPSDEYEIIVPNKAYQNRVDDMSSIVDNIIKYANDNNVNLPYDRDYILTLFNKRDKENVKKLEAHLMNYIDKRKGNKIRESVNSKTFTFPNLRQAIDFFWKDRDAKIETVPIKKLVDDNDLLNDDDLQSYHQRQWDNKKASEFSIDKSKASMWRISEVPYAVRKKDGKLELGDGRHRTRALYNDGYEYVTLPVISESKLKESNANLQEDKSGIRVGDEITDTQAKTFYDRGYIDILVKNDNGESKLIPAWHSNETQKELSRELVKDKKTGKDSLKITGNKVDLPKFEQVVSDIKKELGDNIKFYTQSPKSNKAYPNEIENDVQDRVTGKAYKLFKVVDGKLYPPIVKNTGAKETPTNVWIKCGSPEFVEVSASWGKPQVSKTSMGNLAFRAGWHLGELPYAPQFESRKNPGYLSSDKFVWAECEYDATINYQDRAMSYGFTKDGKFTNSAAGLPYRPIGGYYKYRTNPNPNTIAWVITGSMKVNKVLEDSEVEKICKENGVPYLKRPGGEKTLKELGLKESKTTPRIRESLLQEGKQDIENFKKWIENNEDSLARGMSAGNKEAFVNNWANEFNSIRQNLKSPYNDFYYWIKLNDWNAFTKFMKEQRDKKDAKQREKDGARLIYSDSNWKVYEITTYEASVKYGANTKWCISGSKRWSNGENGRGYWNDYTSKGVKFYFFINKDTKYAIAIYPNGTDFEIFDEQDNSIAYIPNAPIIDDIKVDYYSHNEDRLMLNLIKTGQLPHVCSLLSQYLWVIGYSINIYDKNGFDTFLQQIAEGVNEDWVKWLAVYNGLKDEEWYKQETGEEYDDYWGGDTTWYLNSNLGFLDNYATLSDALTKDNPYFDYDNNEYFISDLEDDDIRCCKDWIAVWLYIASYIDETDLIDFAKRDIRDNWDYEDFEKVGLSKEYLQSETDLDESLKEHLMLNVELEENTTNNIKLIAYHSSPKKFNKFNLSNFDAGQGDGGMYGKGHYFTNSIELAKSWNEQGYLYKVELTFKHPYICKTNADRDELSNLINSKLVKGKNTNDLTNFFNQGYDGVISYDEDWETDNGVKYFDQYVAFKDNQIKILDIEEYDTNINEYYANNLDESLDDFEDEVGKVYHGGIEKSLHKDFRSILWFTEDYDYALDFGENIFICNLNLKNTFIVGNTDGYIRGLMPTQFSTDFTRLANNLKVTPKELLKCNPEAKNIYSIVRTKAFKDLCIKNGYDSVETEEFGHVCFGVFNLDQVDIVDTDFEDESTLETLSPMDESLKPNLREELLLEKGTDYKKQAVKIISNSGLFDEDTSTKIIDGLFRQDIHAFNHAPAWLEKYLKGIARMLVEYCDGDKSKAQQFLNECPSEFEYYLTWVKQNREKIGNSLDDEFVNNLTYEQVKEKNNKIRDEIDAKSKDELSKMKFSNNSNYTLVPIDSYEQMHKLYGGHWTGDGTDEEGEYAGHGGTSWCHTNSKNTYDNWTKGGNKFFVLQRNDWKDIPFNENTNKEMKGKDDYGNSLIAILVNKYGKLNNATLRCNHVGVSGSADNQYDSYAELSKIAGFNVEEEVLKYDFEEFSIDKLFTVKEGVLIRTYEGIDLYKDITEYTIPDGTIGIGAGAFSFCTRLTSITIPNSVTSIGSRAFRDCSSLTSIVIPNSVTSIGYYAFYNCSSLTSIEIPSGVTSIGIEAFYNCHNLTSITIPSSVTRINTYSFGGCSSLTSITIPPSVKSIGEYSFRGCSSLISITIPSSVKSIGSHAFYDCSSLTSIVIPTSVTSIGKYAFDNCSPNLTVFTDNEYATQYCNSNGIKCAPLSEYHKS